MSTCTKNDELRRCSGCGEKKPAECFCRNSRTKTGLNLYCRECENARQRERVAARAREYDKVTEALEEVKYEKVCRICKRLLPSGAFSKSGTHVDYLNSHCKCCNSKCNRRRKYGISDKILDEMLAVKTCQMPGCGKKLDGKRGTHIDHCHKTGKVRAVLCQKCNQMLGYIEKNLHLVQPMLDYIAKHKADDEPE